MSNNKLPVVILISGRGSNLQAIIDAQQKGELDVDIKAVISNRPGVTGLERASKVGIPALTLDHKTYASRDEFDQALQQCIDQFEPQLIILAGFMRVLGDDFVNHYRARMLNIHPSLLPKYPGLNTHQLALDNHDTVHGASVHFVTTELDGGPVVIQTEVPVMAEDSADSLAARVLPQEHQIFCQAIQWYADKRLKMEHDQAYLDNEKLIRPHVMKTE